MAKSSKRSETGNGAGTYNPLDRINIARSIEWELLQREVMPLDKADAIEGAGIYAIYYCGDFEPYAPVRNLSDRFDRPLYVGKAIPKGGRKGGLQPSGIRSRALADRLRQHSTSIREVENLEISDFWIRYLVVDDIWIPLGENMLIETFAPVWNQAVDGFGNKDPGKRRKDQFRSPWDVLHPGRSFAEKLGSSPLTPPSCGRGLPIISLGEKWPNFRARSSCSRPRRLRLNKPTWIIPKRHEGHF